jgi:ATP-binding cassette subfamily B protein
MSKPILELSEEEFAGRLHWSAWRPIAAIIWTYRYFAGGMLGCAALLAVIDSQLPAAMGRVFDALGEGEVSLVWFHLSVYGVLSLLLALFVFFMIICAGKAGTGLAYEIRRVGFDRLQSLPFSYYDTRSVGWLMSRLTSDTNRVANTSLWFCVDILWGSCLILFSGIMMLRMSWRVGLPVLGIVPLLLLITRVIQVRLLQASRDVSRGNSRITARHTENINGVRTTKALAREVGNQSEFAAVNHVMQSAAVRHGLLAALYMPLVWMVGGIGSAVALRLGAGSVMMGAMSIGELIAFMSYVILMIMPVMQISRQFAELQRAQAAAERIASLLSEVPAIRDSAAVRERVAAQVSTPSAGMAEDGLADELDQIEFSDVGFHYVPGQPVLADFNLTVSRGQTIALVGPTGGGKSTIVQLMCRFYEPTSGRILIHGRDYRERSLHWLQSHLGFVLQEPQLFSGTIADNIRYGRLEANDAEVREAAGLVQADRFIEAMQAGYATKVGEGGVKLSSGQKQLISFARAVLADPRIFVMDEATSSVDTETEQAIQSGLAKVLAGRISIVIAHRLSTIRRADRILFIEGGHIVEEGTHEALLAAHGRYFRLYSSQFQRDLIDHG